MFLIDWLTFTSKTHSFLSMQKFLGLMDVNFKKEGILHGYDTVFSFEGIKIGWSTTREDMGLCVEFTGNGCRSYETYSSLGWRNLLVELNCTADYHVTRLDVAYDDREGEKLLDLAQLMEATRNGEYVSKFRTWQVIYGNMGEGVNFGSRTSDMYIRIYNKTLERINNGFADDDFKDFHWIRFELQLRDTRAINMIRAILEFGSVGKAFIGVVAHILRFCIPSEDSNRRRWKTASYWSRFIDGADKISLFASPGTEYNILNLENYVVGQAGAAIYTYIKSQGLDKLVTEVNKKQGKLQAKYERILHSSAGI